MKIAEIYAILDEIAPFCDQESWDNSGLILGDFKSEFERIYLSLDLDSALVEKALPNSLFITHHPLIFKGLKSLNPSLYPANLIYKMVQKNMSLISLHTNYDKHILNKFVAENVLKYEITDIKDFIVFMKIDMKFDDLAKDIKEKLQISNLRAVKTKENIKTIALCTGSGSEFASNLGVDCFLTGDVKYHTALENFENNVSLIDINHFESERYFGASLQPFLQKNQIEVIITNSINPFKYY